MKTIEQLDKENKTLHLQLVDTQMRLLESQMEYLKLKQSLMYGELEEVKDQNE